MSLELKRKVEKKLRPQIFRQKRNIKLEIKSKISRKRANGQKIIKGRKSYSRVIINDSSENSTENEFPVDGQHDYRHLGRNYRIGKCSNLGNIDDEIDTNQINNSSELEDSRSKFSESEVTESEKNQKNQNQPFPNQKIQNQPFQKQKIRDQIPQ